MEIQQAEMYIDSIKRSLARYSPKDRKLAEYEIKKQSLNTWQEKLKSLKPIKKIMKLKVGMIFTGNQQCFTGKVEVIEIDDENNRLRVGLTKKHDTFTSNWNEDWDLQHTIWGFERGDYFISEDV